MNRVRAWQRSISTSRWAARMGESGWRYLGEGVGAWFGRPAWAIRVPDGGRGGGDFRASRGGGGGAAAGVGAGGPGRGDAQGGGRWRSGWMAAGDAWRGGMGRIGVALVWAKKAISEGSGRYLPKTHEDEPESTRFGGRVQGRPWL